MRLNSSEPSQEQCIQNENILTPHFFQFMEYHCSFVVVELMAYVNNLWMADATFQLV